MLAAVARKEAGFNSRSPFVLGVGWLVAAGKSRCLYFHSHHFALDLDRISFCHSTRSRAVSPTQLRGGERPIPGNSKRERRELRG
jgi:hypothetical protein